ncbi:GNAT family N-acetyltransferase [Pollutimonas sp. M17]|uniref:GNAT family N-acetyltransferase n=1 Tax=Pollutimonas sp. M17 TaxID=2962065 RepID=UPI0021F44E9E|nr:N-acetyltransferase [Pollutimonas sp. M17]UYO93083.1 N-acetyltransferase [Pollutimonas sp. M17]
MTKPIIRPETPEDVAVIQAVIESAFLGAPHANRNEQFILAALRDAGALTLSLVAVVDESIVGNVAVSPVSISDGAPGWFGVGPVAVVPDLQRRGIGSELMREALARLSEQGASGCVVLGDPSYYQRFGFTNNAGLVLPDIPPQYFMVRPFGQAVPTGTVTYHQAFSAPE